jgi:hypothetical protein
MRANICNESNHYSIGALLQGLAGLPCFITSVRTAAKILAVNGDTSIDLPHLPFQPVCLVLVLQFVLLLVLFLKWIVN